MVKQFLTLLFLIPILLASAQNDVQESQKLHDLFEKEWAFQMKEFPIFAMNCGVHEYNDRLPSVSVSDQKRRAEFWRHILGDLNKVDRSSLSQNDKINLDIFKFILKDNIAQVQYESYLMPINAEGGFYTYFPFIVEESPFDTELDYRNYIERLKAFRHYTRQHIELMQLGIKKGMVLPKVILSGYEQGITPHIVDTPEESIFFTPLQRLPDHFSQEVKTLLTETAKAAIKDSLVGGYEALLQFMKEEYYSSCRESIGISELPYGLAYYEQRVRYFTTLPYKADDVFEIGQQEVARIRAEMEKLVQEVSFEGSFQDFLSFLRTDPQFYATTPKELLMHASYIAKKIDGRLPKLFKNLPSLPYGVEPVPEAIAPKYTGGRYVPGSIENHKAGTYWVNTYKLDSRPLYVLPALTLHEAVPGHHLQISYAQGLKGFPEFRKHLYLSSYGEGWALYGEWLGQEMDIYETPYEDFGRLTYEMWRACRLVVDVGIHAKGWTREEAVDFLASNTALSIHEVNTEIDRYIGWPAQALSYKIGELKIRELREKAEAELGEGFDIREFHEQILSNGAVPLFILEQLVLEYLSKK